jgi:uncharacterized protein YodC (DUF2158 family)
MPANRGGKKAMAIFAVGDTVRLKSGGPKMTVERMLDPTEIVLSEEPNYRCQWFAGSKLQEGTFPEQSLMVPEETPQ